jgi:hypothetical protein
VLQDANPQLGIKVQPESGLRARSRLIGFYRECSPPLFCCCCFERQIAFRARTCIVHLGILNKRAMASQVHRLEGVLWRFLALHMAGNGRIQSVDVHNKDTDAIAQDVYWLRNSHGRGEVRAVAWL